MSVLSKPHKMHVSFLTISFTLSIQLSKFLSSLNINFDLLLPVYWLPVTVIVVISELTQTVLHLKLSRACPVFFVCRSLSTKQPIVFQIAVRMCLFATSTVAKQLTAQPCVQVTFLQTKCMTVVMVDSFPHSCYLYFGVSELFEGNMKFLLALISPTDRYNII